MFSIFLSGSVKKGARDTRDPSFFWTDDDLHQIQTQINDGRVNLLNPSSISIPSHLSMERFVADLKYVYDSDIVLVDARTYKGIGIGAEMMFAKILGLPVFCLAPPESEYRKTITVDGVLQSWIHPFIIGLSATICDSLDEVVSKINVAIDQGALPQVKKSMNFSELLSGASIGNSAPTIPYLTSGPYDDGYKSCPFFWGTTPASHVQMAVGSFTKRPGLNALDFGCGDGKNAAFLASTGFSVHAIDISTVAIANARKQWPNTANVEWQVLDVRTFDPGARNYDLIVSTGCLHCLSNADEVKNAIKQLQSATIPGGINVVSSFNSDAPHNLAGHPTTFKPLLLPHDFYLSLYSEWEILDESNVSQDDTHPNTNIPHHHSITRLMARKPIE